MDRIFFEAVAALWTFLKTLLPAALGASVSLAYQQELTWTRRFIQLWVGIIVSYFATGVAAALWPVIRMGALDPFVRQAIGFVVGMIAYKATPKFMANMADGLSDLPNRIIDAIPFLRRDNRP